MQDRQSRETDDIYESLMVLSHQALTSNHYEAAYHMLVAAMHYASDLGDEQYLARVEQEAKAQRNWIDSHTPEHRMSTQSVNKHHGKNLYDMLARQAAAQIAIAKQKNRINSHRRYPWLGEQSGKLSLEQKQTE
ncbi:hypothetical protein H6G17_12210 [Chroococcidiopsis sp. FACHB-1243]|uniref:hypothetical protein n=1 Tax=Chroococcidiopsis sp. [FACHB-1243] TaxID=2692781 RepID=UPI00177BAD29|nr:hypothetical protein [Chroococcidiopsis sp. [FACHB-1243]]MBD2306275.1 hypothetical protein [Chroococcidiopsis sp. [FACHB-1243]]